MDRRSWLWRRRSSEKSPGETESSGSVSSHSERYSDDQDAFKASPINASPSHAQSPEISSKNAGTEVNETVKSLTEKLSAALLDISAKEDLVQQHAKVAEEAVLGWEKAEKEVATLKQQLEAATQKNSALEDKVGHIDGALKECVRQLRQSKKEQEQGIHDALIKKTLEWESDKFKLESQLVELQAQLEAKAEATAPIYHDHRAKVEALEKENMALKDELLAHSEHLKFLTLERELSTSAAETASKQHLESIKKVARLEAECRRLRAVACKSSLSNDHKPISSSNYVESLTDSQSDSGERFPGLDNEPSCSDSWASTLIAELNQFRNEKSSARNLSTSAAIDLMDDFLEMERLAALPEADHGSSSFELEAESDRAVRDSSSKSEVEAVHQQMAGLEEKVATMATEKVEVEMSLNETRNQLKISRNQLAVAEDKLIELQRQLNLVNGEKYVLEIEVEAMEAKRNELERQLESAQTKMGNLSEKVISLEAKVEKEKTMSGELAARYQNMELLEVKRKELEFQLDSAHKENLKLREKVSLLERKVEEEKASSSELAYRCQNMEALEAKRKELESRLESAYLEKGKIHDKVDLLQRKIEEERAFSAEISGKLQSLEAANTKKTELESQLNSAHLEIRKLYEKVSLLEGRLEKERTLSAEFAANAEAVEAKRRELVAQLEAAHLEIEGLLKKLTLLEKQFEEERVLSKEFAAKCLELENEPSWKKREAELHQCAHSNGELKIKQEKERTLAAGKLAECQKTIASLNRQLKSLASLDDFLLEAEKQDLNGDSQNLRGQNLRTVYSSSSPENLGSSTLLNGKESGSQESTSSSALFDFAELSNKSSNNSLTENQ
ncbi:filament-like plant protein 3 [Phoenix dactylifera]|uniref:Filament-like plant protein 3 n=1 Tax=Phoenix dactylifera TaxID=42345 RepID=A0A8B8J2D7_PHODC|nr:filament-like plant protein 3 [Phoenix dactylifera]XP_038988758.1 filament-like plant protein 3 [Phoenix dactylifera]